MFVKFKQHTRIFNDFHVFHSNLNGIIHLIFRIIYTGNF